MRLLSEIDWCYNVVVHYHINHNHELWELDGYGDGAKKNILHEGKTV